MGGLVQLVGPRLSRLGTWLGEPWHTTELWFGRNCVWVAWLALLFAVFWPAQGSGVGLCWWQSATGIPCPGCGMTRSLSCAVRGMFHESWHYHPLGLPILALSLFTAVQSLLSDSARARLLSRMRSQPRVFKAIYLAFVGAFVGFGAARALFHFARLCQTWAG